MAFADIKFEKHKFHYSKYWIDVDVKYEDIDKILRYWCCFFCLFVFFFVKNVLTFLLTKMMMIYLLINNINWLCWFNNVMILELIDGIRSSCHLSDE